MVRGKQRRYDAPRFRKRRPKPSLPLHRTETTDPETQYDSSATVEPVQPRGLRTVAFVIMAAIPIVIGAWALSIIVPVVIEARRAMDDVFVSPVSREHFDEFTPVTPVIPTGEIAAADDVPTLVQTPQVVLTVPPTWTPQPSPTPSMPMALSPTPLLATVPSSTPTELPPTATSFPEWDGNEPLHILLLGVDARPTDDSPPRSDTIIVVRIDPEAKRVDMFSVPRDLVVAIPYFSDGAKVNAAYPWGEMSDIEGGGTTLAAQTIELNFGIRIDYFATVDIAGLEKIVDTIGGVVIDVKAPLKDDQYPTNDYRYTRAFFTTGLQLMNGVQSVQYARTRHSDGDFNRSERQQQLLLAMREQILTTGIITKLPELISAIGDSLRTDLSPRQVLSLARLAQDIDRNNIYSHSLVPYTEVAIIDEGWYLIGDWTSLRWLAQNLPDDPNAKNDPGGS